MLGAVALALAGLLFFKYSIDHGLITPAMRVALGTVVGLVCVSGAEWALRRSVVQLVQGLRASLLAQPPRIPARASSAIGAAVPSMMRLAPRRARSLMRYDLPWPRRQG